MRTLLLYTLPSLPFVLGYVVSSMIQGFVTRERMKGAMGEAGAKSVGVGTFFGFIAYFVTGGASS